MKTQQIKKQELTSEDIADICIGGIYTFTLTSMIIYFLFPFVKTLYAVLIILSTTIVIMFMRYLFIIKLTK